MRRPPVEDGFGYYRMCLVADARRYDGKWWKHPGFWASFSYRTRRLRKFGPKGVRWLMLPIDLLAMFVRMFTSHCQLPATARVGPGLYLPHPDGVVLSDSCRIGSEVALFQQVTIGYWRNKSPLLHSRVAVFAGAKIFGRVTVGRLSAVGANAVVTKDVPAHYIAAGVPAELRPASSSSGHMSAAFRNSNGHDLSEDNLSYGRSNGSPARVSA